MLQHLAASNCTTDSQSVLLKADQQPSSILLYLILLRVESHSAVRKSLPLAIAHCQHTYSNTYSQVDAAVTIPINCSSQNINLLAKCPELSLGPDFSSNSNNSNFQQSFLQIKNNKSVSICNRKSAYDACLLKLPCNDAFCSVAAATAQILSYNFTAARNSIKIRRIIQPRLVTKQKFQNSIKVDDLCCRINLWLVEDYAFANLLPHIELICNKKRIVCCSR